MKTVIAQFIVYPQQYHYAARHANREPGYINSRVRFMTNKITESNFQIVFKHGSNFCLRKINTGVQVSCAMTIERTVLLQQKIYPGEMKECWCRVKIKK